MTTKITVDAHAGWPVKVARIYRNGAMSACETVPANTTRDFHVHDGMDLLVREAPSDPAKLSEGEYRVGTGFNPSGNGAVDAIQMQAAALIDALAAIAADRDHPGARCAGEAMAEIESAAMWAVKAVTKQPR